MNYTSKNYGITLEGDNVQVVVLDSVENQNIYYDFLATDRIISEYNGNVCYGINIIPGKSKNEVFTNNSWKLKGIRFPGNWYGQVGQAVLEDEFGEEVTITATCQKWYDQHAKSMIEEVYNTFIEFTNENYSVRYYRFMKYKDLVLVAKTGTFFGMLTTNVDARCLKNKFTMFKSMIANTYDYINEFEALEKILTKESNKRNKMFLQRLKESFKDLINKTYGENIIDFDK